MVNTDKLPRSTDNCENTQLVSSAQWWTNVFDLRFQPTERGNTYDNTQAAPADGSQLSPDNNDVKVNGMKF